MLVGTRRNWIRRLLGAQIPAPKALRSPDLQTRRLALAGLGGAGGGGGGSAPVWLTSIAITGDITSTTTQLGVSPADYPTNGCAIRLGTTYGSRPAVDITKMRIIPEDPGFNADGSPNDAVTRPLDIYPCAVGIAKSYPDGATYTDADLVAGTLEIPLGQQLYNSLTQSDYTERPYKTGGIVIFEAGFLNGDSGAGFVMLADVTREDSADYPLPIWKHLADPAFRIGPSGSVDVEWIGAHEHFKDGQMFACMEAGVRKAGVDGPVARASAPVESNYLAGGIAPSGLTADVWRTSVSASGLSDGELNGSLTSGGNGIWSRVKPWIGPAMNSYDLDPRADMPSGTRFGDDWSTKATQNLLAYIPCVIDVTTGKYEQLFACISQDGTGILGTDLSGVYTSEAAALASGTRYTNWEEARKAMRSAANGGSVRGSALRTGAQVRNTDECNVVVFPKVPGSTWGQNALSYSTQNVNLAALITAIMPFELRGEGGLATDEIRLRGVTPAGASITNKNQPNGKCTLRGLKYDGTGFSDTSDAIVLAGASPYTTEQTGSTQAWLHHIDCYGEGISAAAANKFLSGLRVMYLTRSVMKHLGHSSRIAWSAVCGSPSQIGSVLIGTTTPMDGSLAVACKLQEGQLISAQQSSPNAEPPNITPTKQFLVYNCRVDTKSAIGATFNHTFGRGFELHGLAWVGTLLGRYSGTTNPLVEGGNDTTIPGFRNHLFIGVGTAGSQADSVACRWRAFYSENGWNRITRQQRSMFTVWPCLIIKDNYFSGNASVGTSGSVVSGKADVYNPAVYYYPGWFVYDNTGGLNPGSGAPTYQARNFKQDGTWISKIPPGTPLTDADYWYTRGSNLTGAYAHRLGNKQARLGVGCYGNVSGTSISPAAGPTTISTLGDWFTDVAWPGSPTWGQDDPDDYYVNDASGSSGTVDGGDFRPKPTGPLMNKRPPRMTWDGRSMTGQTRDPNAWGPAGPLEAA